MAVPSGPDEAGVVVVGAVAVVGAVELGVHVVGADVALGAAPPRRKMPAVGRGHASLLAVLHTGHYKTVRGIAQL